MRRTYILGAAVGLHTLRLLMTNEGSSVQTEQEREEEETREGHRERFRAREGLC